MEAEYFDRLTRDLQCLATDIEAYAGIPITVTVDPERVRRRADGPARLACVVDEIHATILTPAEEYFPSNSVLHELLHINRFWVEQVPQLALCDVFLQPQLETFFANLDNNDRTPRHCADRNSPST
jgi:hypothetical protein